MSSDPIPPTASPAASRGASSVATLLRTRGPAALVAACLLVLPFGRSVEVAVALLAAGGVYVLATERRALLARPAARLFVLVYFVTWLPMLASLVDAVNAPSTGETVLNHLRFFLGGVFIVHYLSSAEDHAWLVRACAWVLAFWVADALVQITLGRDLLGYAAGSGRINALFGHRSPTFSLALAVFCPLLWEHSRRHWPGWVTVGVAVATIAVVLVAETRSAWINVAVVALAYAVLIARRRRIPVVAVAAAVTAAALVGAAALYQLSDRFAERVDKTVATLEGDSGKSIGAINHRFWIWQGALAMIEANPINGVGAGGFRDAFADYADPDDPFLHGKKGIVPTHSHQLLLETLAETGVLGALALVVVLGALARAAWRAAAATRLVMLPYGLCLLAAYFPLNTHMAIYASFWSQIVWWLIALYCAASGVTGASHPRAAEPSPAAAPVEDVPPGER